MLNFGGVDIPPFVKVKRVGFSILPPITNNLVTIKGRAGAYNFGKDVGVRKISVDIAIVTPNPNEVMRYATELAEWLFHEDEQPLIIADEPNVIYYATVDGDTDIEEILNVGEGTIEFICTRPYKYSNVIKQVISSPQSTDEIVTVSNEGSVDTYPEIELTFRQDASSIAVISSDKFVLVGEEETAEKTAEDLNPLALFDPMSSLDGWTSAISVDGGVIAGDFATNGYSFSVSGGDFGSGTYWHGPSRIKTLSRILKDFQVDIRFGFDASKIEQMGRVEVYLLDQNNKKFGKVAVKDISKGGEYPYAEAAAGHDDVGGRIFFVASYGAKMGVWKDWYNGFMRIGRKGKTWFAYFCMIDSNGKHHTRLYKEWVDKDSRYSAYDLAKIQIHIGAYGSNPPVSTMYISDIKVFDMNTNKPSNKVPIYFRAGDVLTIDCDKAEIRLNGEPRYDLLNPSSDFFPLKKGLNGIAISPAVADVKISYQERWL
jgi:predicted phage tail component-like protein